jgi:hypothetical protein
MEVLVICLLVLPPIVVGVVGWAAGRIGTRAERRAELLAHRQRAGYARVAGDPDAPVVQDRAA